MTSGEDLITRQEAALLVRTSVSTLKRREKEGRLKPYKDGHQIVRYKRADVLGLLGASSPAQAGG